MVKPVKHSLMPLERQEEYLAPDELELVLEALTRFRSHESGRRYGGKLVWIREKFVRAKIQGHAIVPLAKG